LLVVVHRKAGQKTEVTYGGYGVSNGTVVGLHDIFAICTHCKDSVHKVLYWLKVWETI